MNKLIIIATAVYFFFSLIFYFITETKPISFIFKNFFNSDISFLVEKKTETIEKYINMFDEKFFNLVLIFPLFIIIIFSIIKIKKILFSKNFLSFKNEEFDINHLDKYNLNYLIAIAAFLFSKESLIKKKYKL